MSFGGWAAAAITLLSVLASIFFDSIWRKIFRHTARRHLAGPKLLLELPTEYAAAHRYSASLSYKPRPTLSAFSPTLALPGKVILVQAFVHLPEQRAAVARLAREADAAASARGATRVAYETNYGDEMTIVAESDSLSFSEDRETLTWTEDPVGVSFLTLLPESPSEQTHYIKLRLDINGTPAGRLRFRIDVSADAARVKSEMLDSSFEQYRLAFLSYSSEDRAFVQTQADLLKAAKIPYFFDVDSLRAGDDWEKKLREKVSESDLFLLYWSPSAARSNWVAQEAIWAKELQALHPEARPDFKTYQIGEAPPIPAELAAHHFERINRIEV